MFQKGQKRSITKILELFSEIPEPISASVLSMGRFRNFPSGEILFCLGDPAKEVFLLIEGRVKTTQVTKNGEEVILRLESPTDLFGSLGMDLQGRHNSTAQAIEESKALVWDTNMFKAALSRFPILERNMQGILERRIRSEERRVGKECRAGVGAETGNKNVQSRSEK